jgi:hypothetical protein
MYDDVISQYDSRFLGSIGNKDPAKFSKAIQRKLHSELQDIHNQDEKDRENCDECYMYTSEGNLIVNDRSVAVIERHNNLSKVASWRYAGRAAIKTNDAVTD